MLNISEIEFSAIRSQGAGGQNVNKVSSAIQLRFDIPRSSFPEYAKQRLLNFRDSRITDKGVVIIKAQTHRHQHLNKAEAIERLEELVKKALHKPKARISTKPSRSSKRRSIDQKVRKGTNKRLRAKPDW